MKATINNTAKPIIFLVLIIISSCTLFRKPEYVPEQEPQYPPSDTTKPPKPGTQPQQIPSLPEMESKQEPQESWGYLTVHSIPSNAQVYLNDQHIGSTPVDSLKIKSGKYHLKVTKDGYEPYEKDIIIGGGKETRCDIILEDQ